MWQLKNTVVVSNFMCLPVLNLFQTLCVCPYWICFKLHMSAHTEFVSNFMCLPVLNLFQTSCVCPYWICFKLHMSAHTEFVSNFICLPLTEFVSNFMCLPILNLFQASCACPHWISWDRGNESSNHIFLPEFVQNPLPLHDPHYGRGRIYSISTIGIICVLCVYILWAGIVYWV